MKLNLEEVEERGDVSKDVNGAGFKLSLGDFRDERIISACVYVFAISRWAGIERKDWRSQKRIES